MEPKKYKWYKTGIEGEAKLIFHMVGTRTYTASSHGPKPKDAGMWVSGGTGQGHVMKKDTWTEIKPTPFQKEHCVRQAIEYIFRDGHKWN